MSDDNLCNPPEGGSFYDRPHLDSMLKIIESHVNDTVWLIDNLTCVHKVFRATLEVDQFVHRTIKAFVSMIPGFMLTDDYKEPLDRTFNALLRSMELKDPNLLVQIVGAMATFNYVKGNIRGAFSNAKTAINYLNEVTEVDAKMQGYIRIIQALSYRHFDGMPPHFIESALELANECDDQRLVTELHLTIGFAHNYRQELEQSLKHITIASSIAEKLGDNTFIMRALLMKGVAYRLKGDMEQSDEYTSAALAMSDGIASERRLGYMLCELAGLRYEQGRYDDAEILYLRAQRMFVDLKMPYMLIPMKHGLGLVYTMQGRFDESRTALQEVLDEYRWNGNNFGIAEIKFALGRCEARSGNPRVARKFFRGAEGLAKRLDPSPARDYLLEWVLKWRARVEAGEFGDIWGWYRRA